MMQRAMMTALFSATQRTTNLTVYRVTPRNYTGLTNLDSGDAAGDVYFGLYEFALPLICRPGSPNAGLVNCVNAPILAIPGFNVYTEYVVEADTRFGYYAGCNPDPDNGTFACWKPKGCWYDDFTVRQAWGSICDLSACHCSAYEQMAVGRSVCNMCDRNATWHHDLPIWRQVERLGQTMDGAWFSTQAAGECTSPDQRVGVDCWWRIVEQRRNVNASCVSDNVVAMVQAANPKCFAACGFQAANRSSDCFIHCLFDTLVGPEPAVGTTSTRLSKEEILAPFVRSFADPQDGGCPEVPPCPSPCLPPAAMDADVARAMGGRFALLA